MKIPQQVQPPQSQSFWSFLQLTGIFRYFDYSLILVFAFLSIISAGCSDDSDPEPYCGDGLTGAQEECDDGNTTSGDGCSSTCELESYCGDGNLDPDEECDDANTTSGDGCSSTCELESYCGDGNLDSDEECDDGNTKPADGCSPACQLYPEQEVFDQIVSDLEAEIMAQGVPGAAIAVVVDGELRFVTGVGKRHVDQDDPVDGDTLFALASVTKSFTGAAALALAEEETVDLSAPISTYLPQFGVDSSFDPDTVTLENLLTHTAGYPNLISLDPADGIDYSQPQSIVDFFAWYDNEPLWFESGSIWNYSNNGYLLAGAVLQAAAGENYADLVTRQVLRPAGMEKATFSDVQTWDATNHAWGHDMGANSTPVVWQPTGERYLYEPMGGLYSSAWDLGKFLESVLADDGSFLSSDSLAIWTSGYTFTNVGEQMYGYGVEREIRPNGGILLGHGGAQSGFKAQIYWVPADGFGVAVVQNASYGWSCWYAADAAVDAFTTLESRAPPVSTDSSEWTAYEGSYLDPNFWGTITFFVDGNTLRATFEDFSTTVDCQQFDLHYWGCDRPAATHQGQSLGTTIYGSFWLDDQSQGEYFSTRYGVATRF